MGRLAASKFPKTLPHSSRIGSGSLEQAWRPLIPVESFTKQPVELEPLVFRPVVGIRWGKPADFTFDGWMDEKQKSGGKLNIKETPRHYFENNIIDFSEQYRQYEVGHVDVQIEEPASNPDWQAYLDSIKSTVLPDTTPEVELEEIQHWICDSGYSYDEYRHQYANGKIVHSYVSKKVTVFYQFNMEPYIPIKGSPQPRIEERGDKPKT